MKKWFTLLLIVTMLLTMVAPTYAAVTGEWIDENLEIQGIDPKIIKDEQKAKMEKVGKVVDFSQEGSTDAGAKGHCMAYEYNVNLWNTILVKQDNDRNPNLTEYITYKMDKPIAGFEFLTQCCAGLGDPLKDISVFVSKTGAAGSWAQVETQATYYEFDRNFYIHWDKAYWFKSTLTNAQVIPGGYKYLKIQFNPCNDSGDVPWNVAIDSVKIILGSNVEPVKIPDDKKLTQTWDEINAERDATRTTKGDNNTTAPANGGGNKTTAPANGGGNKTTAPTNGGGNKTTAPTNGGGNKTTAPTNNGNSTTLGGNITTTTSIDANGEVVTDPTTTATAEDGTVITNPTNNADTDNTIGADDGNADTNTEADPVKKGKALPWIIGGIVVLAGAAAAVFFLLKKKQG